MNQNIEFEILCSVLNKYYLHKMQNIKVFFLVNYSAYLVHFKDINVQLSSENFVTL